MSGCTNIYQQVFCLAVKICAAAVDTGAAAALQTTLQSDLQSLLSNSGFNNGDDWEIAWGPVVWQAPFSDVVDQAAAICYNKSQNIYVVPIAATNPHSPYNVFYEDLGAVPLYMQPMPGTNAGKVSGGNWTALQILLSLQSGGATLAQYLSVNRSADDTLVFCGHSLGGGLTPLLAYALYPTGTTGSGWGNVYTYPTAGPTTADADFATAFAAAYPVVSGSGYQMWNANQFNTHDLVPNAWAGGTASPGLSQITAGVVSWTTAMYYTGIKFSAEIDVLRNLAQAFAGGSDNPYVAANHNALFTGAREYGEISDNATLAKEILFQHTTAYLDQFGVSALLDSTAVAATIQPPLLPLVLGLSASSAATGSAATG